MAPSWLSCCAAREDRGQGDAPPSFPCVGRPADADEDGDAFFECAETEKQLAALMAGVQLEEGPEDETPAAAGRGDCCGELAATRAVLERTRELWLEKVDGLRRAGPELEWADLSAARRMLRANIGDVQKAVKMFVQALECRARHAELFATMRCEAFCDIRVITRDLKQHPVIYMCAGSLASPLRTICDQFMVTFEAACRLTPEDGKVVFVIDMQGLRPKLCMDLKALQELAETLGTVFAERIARIIIVDFSRAAQALWWMLKPLMTQVTRDKFAFVNVARARLLCRDLFDAEACERVSSCFDINRDPRSTDEERALHARRTTVCDVPLGPPLK